MASCCSITGPAIPGSWHDFGAEKGLSTACVASPECQRYMHALRRNCLDITPFVSQQDTKPCDQLIFNALSLIA